jgi:hypothetical protein
MKVREWIERLEGWDVDQDAELGIDVGVGREDASTVQVDGRSVNFQFGIEVNKPGLVLLEL